MMVKTFLIRYLSYESIYDLLNIPKLQANAKLSDFEYENKESRESKNHIKKPNWSSFKDAPYENQDMSQQP